MLNTGQQRQMAPLFSQKYIQFSASYPLALRIIAAMFKEAQLKGDKEMRWEAKRMKQQVDAYKRQKDKERDEASRHDV